jgi:hypothetical protein
MSDKKYETEIWCSNCGEGKCVLIEYGQEKQRYLDDNPTCSYCGCTGHLS